MGSEIDTLKERLTSMLGQLQTESGILKRMAYKNKNQHHRCSYFQYMLKVRRDLRLLKSAKLEELVDSCFLVITGKRPKQKLHLLERVGMGVILKDRKGYIVMFASKGEPEAADPETIEILAIFRGLQLVAHVSFSKIILESDGMLVVKAMQEETESFSVLGNL